MAQAVMTLSEHDNGRTIRLRVGDIFALQLYENATTGYRWSFDDLEGEVIAVREEEFIRRSDSVGGGGHQKWTLAAAAAGRTELKLKRWRQWEGDASIQERIAITLIVEP